MELHRVKPCGLRNDDHLNNETAIHLLKPALNHKNLCPPCVDPVFLASSDRNFSQFKFQMIIMVRFLPGQIALICGESPKPIINLKIL